MKKNEQSAELFKTIPVNPPGREGYGWSVRKGFAGNPSEL